MKMADISGYYLLLEFCAWTLSLRCGRQSCLIQPGRQKKNRMREWDVLRWPVLQGQQYLGISSTHFILTNSSSAAAVSWIQEIEYIYFLIKVLPLMHASRNTGSKFPAPRIRESHKYSGGSISSYRTLGHSHKGRVWIDVSNSRLLLDMSLWDVRF